MRLCMKFKTFIAHAFLVLAMSGIANIQAVHFHLDDEGMPVVPRRPDRDKMPDWQPASAIPLGNPVHGADNNGAAAPVVNSSYISPKMLLTSGVVAASIFGG